MRWLAIGALTGAALAGCGSSCGDLPRLTAERDALRSSYLDLARSGAPPEKTGRADARLHQVERQVFDLEQSCR